MSNFRRLDSLFSHSSQAKRHRRNEGRRGQKRSRLARLIHGRKLQHQSLERRELLVGDFVVDVDPLLAPGTSEAVFQEFFGTPPPAPLGISQFRWTNPASGPSPNVGDPVTVTWSIIPDGSITAAGSGGGGGASDFIEFLDGIYGDGGNPDGAVEDRPWFGLIQNVFDTYEAVSGVDFVYEPNDDGLAQAQNAPGELGVRGDIRIGGSAIDGTGDVLAFNFLPGGGGLGGLDGDLVLDTSDLSFADPNNVDGPDGENRFLTNVLAHEIGHGIGLDHVFPTAGNNLLEPFLNLGFLGPQHNDILAAQSLYGDRFADNDTADTATPLELIDGELLVVDDISIDDNSDLDFFSFEAEIGEVLNVAVVPDGFETLIGLSDETVEPFDSSILSDLNLQLISPSGEIIASVDEMGLGGTESVLNLLLTESGTYTLGVAGDSVFTGTPSGTETSTQLYELRVELNSSNLSPQLVGVRPDASELLQEGDTLTAIPNSLNLLFAGGADLDEETISTDTVRLVRAGEDGIFGENANGINDDVVVSLGFVGLPEPGGADPENLQQIILRPSSLAALNVFDPSSSLPDDFYQIQIIGSGDNPLANNVGVPFSGGEDFTLQFRIDRGAQVVAVVPQPVTRDASGGLDQARDQIVVHFDDQVLDRSDAEDRRFYRLINTTDQSVLIPQIVAYDSDANTVTLTFDSDLPEGTFRLDVGLDQQPTSATAGATAVGLTSQADFSSSGFFFEDFAQESFTLFVADGQTIEFSTTLPPTGVSRIINSAVFDQEGNAVLDGAGSPIVSISSSAASGIASFTNTTGEDGVFEIRVVNNFNPGPFLLEVNSSEDFQIQQNIDDENSSVADATQLGILGSESINVASTIEPQNVPLPPLPGGNDGPGEREIQRESAISAIGTTPILPDEIDIVYYFFPETLGATGAGDPFANLITEVERDITRSSLELYASISSFEFVEVDQSNPLANLSIGVGDLRALDPNVGPDDGVGGLATVGAIFNQVVINSAAFDTSNRTFGDGFTQTLLHEIGHTLGLGHSLDQPSILGSPLVNDVLPADSDIIHLQRIAPPDATDIDLFEFDVDDAGVFRAETFAERFADFAPGTDASALNTVISLYREVAEDQVQLVARNDNFFGTDSFVEVELETGTYFVAVTSAGNENFSPVLADSGFGGFTDGDYGLTISFEAGGVAGLRDADGTLIDGDRDGTPGGVHSFHFQVAPTDSTIFVDRANDATLGAPDGDGSQANPFDTISSALDAAANRIVVSTSALTSIDQGDSFVINDGINQAVFTFSDTPVFNGQPLTNQINLSLATSTADVVAAIETSVNAAVADSQLSAAVQVDVSGSVINFTGVDQLDVSGTPALLTASNLVRIVGNGGDDGDLATTEDNLPFLIGFDTSGNALRDGSDFLVPQGTTVVIDQGALFGLRRANLDVGTSTITVSREAGALQVLGTPEAPVAIGSFHDDTLGGDSDNLSIAPAPGDFGGIVFRDDSDLEQQSVFLNQVNFAEITNGGGSVFVDTSEATFSPIHLIDARPTITFNRIVNNADSAISANPDSFEETFDRVGPEVLGNSLVDNSINGLFVRIETEFGSVVENLTVFGRFDDTDIPHVLTESLIIEGSPGGRIVDEDGDLQARPAGRLVIDPGTVVQLSGARIEAERGSSSLIAEGTADRPIIFTSLQDDRFGGSGSFDTDSSGPSLGTPGDFGGIFFGETSSGSLDFVTIAFGGGSTPIEGTSADFNALEIHQADVRIANSTLSNNADGFSFGNGNRNGRGANTEAVIYVRGAQPIIVNNTIVDNAGAAININASALRFENQPDPGRSTGNLDAFDELADNFGPLIRLNRLDNNDINGLEIRAELLTTEVIFDDTDIVHVIDGEIIVDNLHTFGGLRIQSSNSASLVVAAGSPDAGFTATGTPLDIVDRIGGAIQVIGTPGNPVIFTDIADDTVGAGFTPSGELVTNTNNSAAPTTGTPGAFRGFLFDELSNDRNVALSLEAEDPLTSGFDTNTNVFNAEFLGVLAADEFSGDENSRLGFEVHGFISPDDPSDVDVFSFSGTAGTTVFFDIDRTDTALDAVIEILSGNGTVLARSVRSGEANFPGNLNAGPIAPNPLLGGDFFTTNFRDPGLSFELPGAPGSEGTFFVRVRSAPLAGTPITSLEGITSGEYQLQIRLRQVDEFPGSTVQFADIRFAETAIDVRGLPNQSPLVGEAGDIEGNDTFATGQFLGNLLETDTAAISIAGNLSDIGDVDFFQFDVTHTAVQVIEGVNDGQGTVAVVLDVDFADGLVRPDTTLGVYDEDGNLIFVGRASNIEDDRAILGGTAADTFSRGSTGTRDPFIGPFHITPGQNYSVAVFNDQQLPEPLLQTFLADAPNPLIRLEPVNSVQRVVEDRIGFQGFNSGGTPILPEVNQGIFNVSDAAALETQVIQFNLNDVALFVASSDPLPDDSTMVDGSGGSLRTTQLRDGTTSRVTEDFFADEQGFQDITIRSDGTLFGIAAVPGSIQSAAQIVQIDPSTGNALAVFNDNVNDPFQQNDTIIAPDGMDAPPAESFTNATQVGALTFQRDGAETFQRDGADAINVPQFNLFYTLTEGNALGTSSRLVFADDIGNLDDDGVVPSIDGAEVIGAIQPLGVTFASANLVISDGPDSDDQTTIQFDSNLPGDAGNNILINVIGGGDNGVEINVTGTVITIQLEQTGGPPPTGGPSASEIVNAINADEDARALVRAIITDGNAGTGAVTFGSVGMLTGGSDDTIVAPLLGTVTGLSFDNFSGTGDLFGVTDAGEFLSIESATGIVLEQTLPILDGAGIPVRFQSLTLGPQNVQDGSLANTLFAVTDTGEIFALTSESLTTGTPVQIALTVADADAAAAGNPAGLVDSVQLEDVTPGGTTAVGLAFSPLDFNLFHPSFRRGTDAGRGINPLADGSRTPSDETVTITEPITNGLTIPSTQDEGGLGFFFGLAPFVPEPNEQDLPFLRFSEDALGNPINAQFGVRTSDFQADLSSNPNIVGTFNLPGGAAGILQSASFSLAGSVAADRPVLLFNYFLETQNADGSSTESDNDDPFQDSVRVFADFVDASGVSQTLLLATNNSQLSNEDPVAEEQAELPSFLTARSDGALDAPTPRPESQQVVQELFDNTGSFRQARVDLSQLAGVADIRLRFEFSSAGVLLGNNGGSLFDDVGELSNEERSIRGQDNQFEGFFLDDIIIGFAERGEAVTGANGNTDIFDLASNDRTENNLPDAFPIIESGDFQLEIRRVDEFATLQGDDTLQINTTFDTNDRHILDVNLEATLNFEPGDESFIAPVPAGGFVLDGNAFAAAEISPFDVTTDRFSSGSASLGSGPVSDTVPLSIYQATLSELGSTLTSAGQIQFDFSVSSTENVNGLRFFIDGVEQPITPAISQESTAEDVDLNFATGEIPFTTVRAAFSAGNPTFTFVFDFTDSSNPTGANQAFIDNIQVFQGGTGLLADQNRERPQGVFIIDSNFIRDSNNAGINIQPGTELNPGVSSPGSLINFPIPNVDSLIPGVVVQNNVIVGGVGINFSGEANPVPNRPVPFARFVNNTLFGQSAGGEGIQISNNASATILNNVIAEFETAISISNNSGSDVEVISNFFQNNANNGPIGSDALIGAFDAPLFVDANAGNFLLVDGSAAIDSGLSVVQERFVFGSFRDTLGLLPSPVIAPERDVFGQLREDSQESAGGGGSSIFIDRGATDQSDSEDLFAVLQNPVDFIGLDNLDLDGDPNETVVLVTDPIVESFSILISDGITPTSPFEGTGVNPATVNPTTVSLIQNNVPLIAGIDFNLGFNTGTGELLLTPLSTLFAPGSAFEIVLDNTVIADLAGNPLRANRSDGSTQFTIILPEVTFDFGDASGNQTTLGDDGARHVISAAPSVLLGTILDTETDGIASTGADTDDQPQTIVFNSTGPALFNTSVAAGEASIEIAGTNAFEAQLSVNIGGREVTFEFVPFDEAPSEGNIPVRFVEADPANGVTGDDAAALAGLLAAAIQAEFVVPNGGLSVAIDDSAPNTIRLETVDDEDGLATEVVNDGAEDRIAFVLPGSTATDPVLSILNPLDQAGALLPLTVTIPEGFTQGFLDAFIDFDGLSGFDAVTERIPSNLDDASDTSSIAITTQLGLDTTAPAAVLDDPDTPEDESAPALVTIDPLPSGSGGSVTINDEAFMAGSIENVQVSVTLGDQTLVFEFLPTAAAGATPVEPSDPEFIAVRFASDDTAVSLIAALAETLEDELDRFNAGVVQREFNVQVPLDGFGNPSNTLEVSIGNEVQLRVFTPEGTADGVVNARFRFSPDGGLGPDGIGVGGEVEDHQVEILSVVNTAPSFEVVPPITVLEDIGEQTLNIFAEGSFVPGSGTFEGGQDILDFSIVPDFDSSFFASGPSIDNDGNLTFTLANDATGSVTLNIEVIDDGGSENGGNDTSDPAPFIINVANVADDLSVLEDSGAQSLPLITDSFDTTNLVFSVVDSSTTAPELFDGPITVDDAGNLIFTPAADFSGTSEVTIDIQDTAEGELNNTSQHTVTITVDPVNDAPSFAPVNPTILEDAGGVTLSIIQPDSFAGDANPEAVDGAGQDLFEADQSILNFAVSVVSGGDAFASAPTINSQGDITFEIQENVFGPSVAVLEVTVTDDGGTANGGVDTSAPQLITITIDPVNDQPSFEVTSPPEVLEDSGPQSFNLLESFEIGNPQEAAAGQVILGFQVSNLTNPQLFAAAPTVAPDGTLTYTPADNEFGTAVFELTLQDDGGIPNGGVDTSDPETVTITINPVNDQPSVVLSTPPTVLEDSGSQSVNILDSFDPGNAQEEDAGQDILAFQVSAPSNPALFSVAPTIAPDGTLTYTPADGAFGTQVLDVVVQDDGGTINGGSDTSQIEQVTITIDAVNDAPSFTAVGTTVLEDASEQTFSVIAPGSFDPGNEFESDQAILDFQIVGVDDASLFDGPIEIDSDGNLTFTPLANAFGVAVVDVVVQDDGGIENGVDATDVSSPQPVTITIDPVNDQPSAVLIDPPAVLEDSPASTFNVLESFDAGNDFEAAQNILGFTVTSVSDPALFSQAPTIDPDGNLTFTSAENTFGVATIELEFQDDGGTESGGVDTSETLTLTIVVEPVNDAPSFVLQDPPAVNEDAGLQSENVLVDFDPGNSAEADQQILRFEILDISNPDLFAGTPQIDVDGVLTYTPADDAAGSSVLDVVVLDDGGGDNGANESSVEQITVTVNAVNDAPTISDIPDQTLSVGGPAPQFAFDVGDVDDDVNNLVITAVSSNQTLFPDSDLLLTGTGTQRTLIATPTAGETGFATITLTVTDAGGLTATDTFTVEVRGPILIVSPAGPGGAADPPDLPGAGPQPTSFAQQRSSIGQLQIALATPLTSVDPTGITLTNLGVNADVDPDVEISLASDQLILNDDGTLLTLELGAGQLPDGVYQLELSSSITGGASATFTGDEENGLFVLTGDFDGSGAVTALDFATFAYWLGQPVPAAPQYVDLDSNGEVDVLDLAIFEVNFRNRIFFPGGVTTSLDPEITDSGTTATIDLVPTDPAILLSEEGGVTVIEVAGGTVFEVQAVLVESAEPVVGFQVNLENSSAALEISGFQNEDFVLGIDSILDPDVSPVDRVFSSGDVPALTAPPNQVLGSFFVVAPNQSGDFVLTSDLTGVSEENDTLLSDTSGAVIPIEEFGDLIIRVEGADPQPVVIDVSPAGAGGQVDPPDLPGAGPQPTSFAEQRSELGQLVIDLPFAQDAVSADDIVLTNLGLDGQGPGVPVALTDDQLSLSADGLQLIIDFGPDQRLDDGVYELTLLGGLTGGDPITISGNEDNQFYVLTGDFNGDNIVNIEDFATFAYWFGNSVGVAPSYVDINGDGFVNIQDFDGFADNFGELVSLPGVLASSLNTEGTGEDALVRALRTLQNPHDVTGDGLVTPLDALTVINQVASGDRGSRGDYLPNDVNRDGIVTPLDALNIINALVQDQAATADSLEPLTEEESVTALSQSPVSSSPIGIDEDDSIVSFLAADTRDVDSVFADNVDDFAEDLPSETAVDETIRLLADGTI